MIGFLKSTLTIRQKVAVKVGGKLESGEHLAHFFYGIALVTEHHAEVTLYSVSAVGLGIVALGLFLVGDHE